MKKPKKIAAALVSVALVAGIAGCATAEVQEAKSGSNASSTSSASGTAESGEVDLSFSNRDRDASYDEATATKIDLSGSSAAVSGNGATAEGSTVTISAEGTYLVKGTLSNGQIKVNLPGTEDKAQIVLAGAAIHNETGPAIYVQQADKVFVTLAEGTVNELTDGADYAATDDGNDPKAALYSKDDLTINGSGTLNVTGNYYHGIASTDDLRVTGGIISVTSKEDAFHGKDAIKIGGGTLTANAGDDAFHSEYLFYLEDGTVNVEKCTEGYEAEKVYLYGGDSTIVASDDGVNASAAEESTTEGTTSTTATETDSANGIQPNAGMPADGEVPQLAEGEPPALPDGEMSEPPALPDGTTGGRGNGGKFNGERPQDGQRMQGQMPDGTAQDGSAQRELREPSADGQWQGGNGAMNRGQGMGGVMPGASQDCIIRINGGTLRVDAGGDGLDSNGTIEINSGTVLVSGSSSGDNTGLDTEFGATVNGGEVILVGSAGMAKDFTGGTQAHLMDRASGTAGSTVEVLDASGNILMSYTVPKAFQSVIASAPNCSSITVH